MRWSRGAAAVLAVAIAASGLALTLSRDEQPPAPSSPSRKTKPAPTLDGRPHAAPASGRPEANSPTEQRPGQSRPEPSVEAQKLGGPARVGDQKMHTHTLIVHFHSFVGPDSMEDTVRAAGATPVQPISALGAMVVSVAPEDRDEVAARLEESPLVSEVESNHIRYQLSDPNDEYYFDQFHLLATRLPVAWEVTKGSTTLDIAILDTGIDLNHPDFAGRIGPGYDFVNNDAVPMDDEGHGTMVAGIAAARTNNTIGVAGAAWNARIMPVKIMGADGSGTDGDIADGIVWAVQNGAEVINLSLGGPGSSDLLEAAVEYATAQGVVVVAAAGNEGTSEPSYPAAIPGAIAVGATDLYGDAVSFTNYGPWIDLTAPGTDIISTFPTSMTPPEFEPYALGDGTSFSSPIVAGVALLMRAKNPTWTPDQIASKLASSAADRGPHGTDDSYGYGLLDAYAAVGGRKAASPPVPEGDALEPNDLPARASLLAAPVQATISPEGDVDWFTVVAPEPGSISFVVSAPAAAGPFGFDPVVDAFLPDLRTIGTVNGATVGENETVVVAAPVAGPYSFRVSNANGSREPQPYTVNATVSSEALPEGSAGDVSWVLSSSPADFAVGVGLGAQPTVVFSRDVNPDSITAATARLIDGVSGAAVPTSLAYEGPSRTLTMVPAAALKPGRPYLVDVRGVTGTVDVTMDAPFRSRFTTAAPAANPPTRADVNGDGYDDVIIGVPDEDFAGKFNAGVVHVMYGSASGAKTSGSLMLSQDSTNVPDVAESGDRFGSAIATGDVNNDGYDDVAVGVPGEDLRSVRDAGLIHLFLGSASGLRTTGSQVWHQDSSNIPDVAETSDKFGSSLVFGDFDNTPGADLAIGSPGEKVGSLAGAGAVHILRGASYGLTRSGAQLWTQQNIDGSAGAGNAFGRTLATGDFDGDTHDDLAVGATYEDIDDTDQGTVTLMRGTIVGLRPNFTLFSEMLTGTPSVRSERFGSALAVEDFGGFADPDGYDELAIGAPGAASGAGRVDVLFSDWIGVGAAVRSVHQTGNGNVPEAGDAFGGALAAGRVRGAPTAWLAIAAPYEDLGSVVNAGVVHVVSPTSWLTTTPTVPPPISQDSPNIPDSAEREDRFGNVLRLLDVDKDGQPDLVVGVPGEGLGSASSVGVTFVIRRAQTTSPSAQLLTQDSSGVPEVAQAGDRFGAALGG